jgi:hypothetical protein
MKIHTNFRPVIAHLGRQRLKWGLTLLAVIVLHLSLDIFYRPWIFGNGINDYGFAASFTQCTAIFGITCIMLLVEYRPSSVAKPPMPFAFFVFIPVLAMTLYEFLQILLPATFDWMDLVYCLIGGVLNALLLKYWLLR